MGGNSGDGEVPSPLAASTTSTTSSEQSHSHRGGHHSGYGVPNPFATAPAPPHPGWGSHAYETGAPHPGYGHPPPPPPHYHPHHHGHHPPPGAIPMVVSAPTPPSYHAHAHAWARENSCPNFSIGTTDPNSPPSATKKGAAKRRSYSKANSTGSAASNATSTEPSNGVGGVGDSVNSRRQKRLERNRESARLSRRRRKQYLEILEERVTQLSMEVDQGRRTHAAQAVTTTLYKRREVLEATDKSDEEKIRLLEFGLGRTSPEMMLVSTFKYQQLKSFSLPPHSKFVLWLTLQNDQYFRGGRAASERLSAARIGERMLNSGNDRVPPAQSMWPLFCNEVGLSYDQEERVRSFQRTLLQCQDSWLQRHAARAADLAMAAVHDSTQAMTLRLGQRDKSMQNVLTAAQKVKFLSWAEKNRDKLQRVMQAKVNKHMETNKNPFFDDRFNIEKKHHVAANLYIVNHRLQAVMQKFPRAAPLVTGLTLKKLSRRPSFESLGRAPGDKPGKDGDGSLSREQSFASSGSLKRSASTLSMGDGERPQLLQISPDDAEQTCRPQVDKVLGFVQEIIPPTPPRQYHSSQHHQASMRIPSPTQVTSAPPAYYHHPAHAPAPHYGHHGAPAPPPHPHQPMTSHPAPMAVVSSHAPPPTHPPKPGSGHKKVSSFIPPYLNVVPEEMFPNDGAADDFLMSLVDEDWAIGEGIDMDTTQ